MSEEQRVRNRGMLIERQERRARPAVSVIDVPDGTVGACQHLRLNGPFSWLERNEGWAPLEYALKPGPPDPRQIRRIARLNRVTLGRAYPSAYVQGVLAGVREGVTLAPSDGVGALLVLRELTPEFVEEGSRLARQRRIPLVYDTPRLSRGRAL